MVLQKSQDGRARCKPGSTAEDSYGAQLVQIHTLEGTFLVPRPGLRSMRALPHCFLPTLPSEPTPITPWSALHQSKSMSLGI